MIRKILTDRKLAALGACPAGRAAFRAAFPTGIAAHAWTRDAQIRALKDPTLCAYLGWAWRAGALPAWSMEGADLSGAYLAGADLWGANLRGANLAGAYLAHANLSGANLSGAYLARANLADANLSGANLSGANLAGAYLRDARADYAPPGWTRENGILRR